MKCCITVDELCIYWYDYTARNDSNILYSLLSYICILKYFSLLSPQNVKTHLNESALNDNNVSKCLGG